MRQPDIVKTEFASLIQLLADARVEFIVAGGVAAFANGAVKLTLDLDVVCRRSNENLQRLADALAPCQPYPRGQGVPPGLPFVWDAKTMQRGLNFTLGTAPGDINLLGEIVRGGDCDQLLQFAEPGSAFGVTCPFLGLEKLIKVKRAAGRAKDYEAIAELEVILEERKRLDS